MPNNLPLGGAGLASIKSNQEQVDNKFNKTGLFFAQVLKIIGEYEVPGGLMQEMKARGYNVTDNNGYYQILVRVEELHSHLDEVNDIELHPIAVVGSSLSLEVGSTCQVSFSDNYSCEGGFVVGGAAGGTGGKNNSKGDEPSKPSSPSDIYKDVKKGGKFPPGAGARAQVADINFLPPKFATPFRVVVSPRSSVSTGMNNLRKLLTDDLEIVAEAAGWYYGAVKTSRLKVMSAYRECKKFTQDNHPKGKPELVGKCKKPATLGNHSSGNAVDFLLEIDGTTLGLGESWAFIQALRAAKDNFNNIDTKSILPKLITNHGSMGLYSSNFPVSAFAIKLHSKIASRKKKLKSATGEEKEKLEKEIEVIEQAKNEVLGLINKTNDARTRYRKEGTVRGNPHFDIRIKGVRSYTQNNPPWNVKRGTGSTKTSYYLFVKKRAKKLGSFRPQIAENARVRVHSIYEGITKKGGIYEKNYLQWHFVAQESTIKGLTKEGKNEKQIREKLRG